MFYSYFRNLFLGIVASSMASRYRNFFPYSNLLYFCLLVLCENRANGIFACSGVWFYHRICHGNPS
jgi:hypothetical protein